MLNVFYECSSLTSITIPNSVTSIGNNAFEGCSSLTSITIPNSVTSIGVSTFEGCSGLTSITIPNSVTYIGTRAFDGCSSLTSITIPNSVTYINDYVFYGCSSLTSITIPNSVTSIGKDAFHNCSSLTSITIPNSVTSIGKDAFRNCSSLTEVTIPNSVTTIGKDTFYGCSSLASVTIPNSVTSIGEAAFRNCSSLTEVTIPNSVTSIGERAFYGCSSLTSITIPNSVTSIGEYAFNECRGLASVVSELENPFNIFYNTFYDGTYQNATLYVPTGTIDKYKSTESWKRFINIVSLGTHTVTYKVDGQDYQSVSFEEGEAITPIEEPIKEGYTFSGWSGLPATMPANDVIVTGTFSVNKYKLIYTIDGKEYKTVEVEYGSTITPEQAPEGDYATFEWVGVPETMPAHDVTVTATYTTGINGNIANRTEVNKGIYFNLNGQRIEGQPSQKGVYIKNGKKVLMK